ncbi:DUF72 domain-containing protein [Nakamurella endophytica]|uniref:DUF72 domain-containing protein n=1 Tax=Nakamurella endophytica TaxID=1748367 RepID=A0A917WDJ3_9ACTN|nr:DUF72 domain-containing protein [Nakamurella endophytica]GGL97225.1 hypothetical protein GCM10011594_16150 [Nakamurella endophytica]
MSAWIGTSGWTYPHWDGVLYPPGTVPEARLDRYLQEFRTVELNSSFYRWPSPHAFAAWRRRLPSGFRFSVKAPRGLTHGRRLHQPEPWLERIAAGWGELDDSRGMLLFQLPPDQERDDARLAWFLGRLPKWIRSAVEFRHPSWTDEAVFEQLEAHRVAYCVMSGAGLPCVLRATAPEVYVRFHGPDDRYLYAGSYSDDDLRWWADRIREWEADGRQVFAYFNNDGDGNAVRNARTLKMFLGR